MIVKRIKPVFLRRVVLPMSSGSVTHWLGQLQAGNHDAAQPLWERYSERLAALARRRLRAPPRRRR